MVSFQGFFFAFGEKFYGSKSTVRPPSGRWTRRGGVPIKGCQRGGKTGGQNGADAVLSELERLEGGPEQIRGAEHRGLSTLELDGGLELLLGPLMLPGQRPRRHRRSREARHTACRQMGRRPFTYAPRHCRGSHSMVQN